MVRGSKSKFGKKEQIMITMQEKYNNLSMEQKP